MNRKLLIGLGALAAVVLLGVFVVMPLVLPGDDGEEDPASAADAGADDDADGDDDAGEDEADDEEADDEPDPVDETFEVFTARDPFQQLVSDDGGSAIPISDDGDGDGDGGDGDADGGDGGSGDGGDGDGSASVGGTTVQLVEVFTDPEEGELAQLTVNGSGYEVAEGDDFAGRFRVLDISGSCTTLLYGDQRFTLCEGETVRK